jgi:cytoskeletal protein CcmA (bactofilin family)
MTLSERIKSNSPSSSESRCDESKAVPFNKGPETRSSFDPIAALIGVHTHFDDRNVPLSPKANHRELSATLHRSSDACTYIDSRTKINGQLSFEGPAQIDGQIDGEIVAQSSLVIGHDALVNAKIKAASVVVAGTVSGEISASERIELQSSAKMSGSLTAPRIAVNEGAVFEGNCTMTSKELGEQLKPADIRRQEQMELHAAAYN